MCFRIVVIYYTDDKYFFNRGQNIVTKRFVSMRKISDTLLLSIPRNATLIRLRLSNYQIPRIRILDRMDVFRGTAPYKGHSLWRFRMFIVLRGAGNEFRRSCVHPRVLLSLCERSPLDLE